MRLLYIIFHNPSVAAQVSLACLLEAGRGIEADVRRAMVYYEEARLLHSVRQYS